MAMNKSCLEGEGEGEAMGDGTLNVQMENPLASFRIDEEKTFVETGRSFSEGKRERSLGSSLFDCSP